MDSYLGEIRMFAGTYAPFRWAFCDGSLIEVSANENLFYLIGTTYGGDGITTFGLPDLRGRIPVNQGIGPNLTARIMGEMGGVEEVTLTIGQVPAHSHAIMISSNSGTSESPANAFWAANVNQYAQPGETDGQMNAQAITMTGAGQAHENMMPYLCINYIICLDGCYPNQF